MQRVFVLILCFARFRASFAGDPDYHFPDGFVFGGAAASLQVEGSWNEDDQAEAIWDYATHVHADSVAKYATDNIACDSYHKYAEDIQLLKKLGVDFYRFSISWPRILPNGRIESLNRAGIDFYSRLINESLANGLEPYITMYNWHLPRMLQDEGGWTRSDRFLVDLFVDYARILFESYGDRVKKWITFNEINQVCEASYADGSMAPHIKTPGIGGYECAHAVLLAHGKAFRMYEREFKASQKGEVGVAIDSHWNEPSLDPKSDLQGLEMNYGWYLSPILSGNYPQIMIDRIKEMKSRLPEFTTEEIAMLNSSYDFLGLNHYSSDRVYFANDSDGEEDALWLKVVPWGLRKVLVWLKARYGNPPVLVIENGFADTDGLGDYGRASYMKKYLYEVLRAIHEDKCNVIGYTAWSLMDNIEWMGGYTLLPFYYDHSNEFVELCIDFSSQRLHFVNFTELERPRTPKLSSYVYNNIIKTRHIDWDYYPILV